MASLSNSLKCFLLACIFMHAVSASNQMVIYWGQNSAGSFTNIKSEWEQPLRNYCEDSTYDIIVVGFVYLFPSASGNTDPTMPGMNFANHCEVPFDDANPYVLDCRQNIAPDIKYCQQRGKKIILSFGGGVGNYGFTSDAQAVTFAHTVWNMFLGGSGSIRPFGTAIFDGIDLDIEGGTQTGYISFINTLRNYFASSNRKYYITAAPQCFYPDRIGPGTGTPLTEAWFDYIFIQFYNNHCGLQGFPTTFNFAKWAAAMSKSANPNVKLFIGAPASSVAAASGFVSLSTLQTISTATQNTFPEIYGGVMLWDASSSDRNGNFGAQVARFVHAGGAETPITPVPATPATTGATKPISPVTTGVALPATTGRVSPSTTGFKVSQPSTTGAKVSKPSTTGSMEPATTGSDPKPSTSASSQSCTTGSMKCLSDTTYSTCSWGLWGTSAQSCGEGTVCRASGNVIYCVAETLSTPVPTPTTPVPTPTTPVPTPTTPVPTPTTPSTTSTIPEPSTTGAVKQTTTGSSIEPSSTTGSSSSNGKCTLGYQLCVGNDGYQTCGNGRNGPEWAPVQKCQTGLYCHPSETANNIYCY